MKRFIVMLLVCVIAFLCSSPVIGLANYTIEYFNMDFEDMTVGEPPVGIAGHSTDNAAVSEAVVCQEDGNEYVAVNTRIRTFLNESVSTGTVCLEFDMNLGLGSVGIGVVYESTPKTYAKWIYGFERVSGSTGKILAYDAPNALPPGTLSGHTTTVTKQDSSDNLLFMTETWQHYKIIIDLDNQSAQIVVDGQESIIVEGISFLGGDNPSIGAIAFYTSRAATSTDKLCLDNIVVYRPENKAMKINFYSYEGAVVSEADIVPAMCEKAEITFANTLLSEQDLSGITLYNKKSGEYEDIDCEIINRKIIIIPEDGFLNSVSEYTLTIPSTITDEFGQNLNDEVVYNFTTDNGGFKLIDFNIFRGEEIANHVEAGENLSVHIDYARVGDVSKKDVILAIVYENDGFLCGIKTQKITLDQLGKGEAVLPFEVLDGTEFDEFNVYLWDFNTRKPMLSKISL